ncbi:MAG: putative toxin-antitoxin system toxin component, PIN family [Pseudomonadota bacterium]
MLAVIDTNIFISYLLLPNSRPAKIITLWQRGKFDVLTAKPQIDELMTVTRYPKIKERISSVLAGRLINELRDLSIMVDYLPKVGVSPDPYDNYLLSIAIGGGADYFVSGDKTDLLALKKYDGVSIISVTNFLKQTGF